MGTDNRLIGYIDGHIRAISYQEAESFYFLLMKGLYIIIHFKQLKI